MWKTMIYQGNSYNNFEISDFGELRNKKTNTIYKTNLVGREYCAVSVSLGSRKNKKCIKIHKAVAETFIPNPNNCPQVNHKDGNKLNNCVDNLEWCSREVNINHAFEHGLISHSCEKNSNAKLNKEMVKFIRTNCVLGSKSLGFRALAKKFNVDKSTIRKAYYGLCWN